MTVVFVTHDFGEPLTYVFDNEGHRGDGTRHFVARKQRCAARQIAVDTFMIEDEAITIAEKEWIQGCCRHINALLQSGVVSRGAYRPG